MARTRQLFIELSSVASLLACASACSSSVSAVDAGSRGAGDAAPDAVTDAATPMDSNAPMDSSDGSTPPSDAPTPDGTGTGACPAGSGDPVACDDGTGSLGTMAACPLSADPAAKTSYHLRVSGSKFATSGACIYETPSACSSAKGDLLEFAGGGGTSLMKNGGMFAAAPYCFHFLDVQWDSDWEDDGMTSGGPVGMGGDILAASQKPQALIEWVHTFLRSSPTTPLCARGSSGGSSELLYQVMHNDGEALLDHVQVISVTPFGRIDKGCDPNSPQEGTNVACSGLPATTEPQYNANGNLVRTITHDPNCDVAGSPLSASERASLQAMSLVPSGFAPVTLQRTSLSAYMCSNSPNATQGQAVDVFGVDADLAAAGMGPYTGLVSLQLASGFYSCAAGAVCPPHVICGADCSGEGYGSTPADQMELLNDLSTNCVLRH